MNTPSTSTTGNVHGMALAALSGPEPAELASIGDFIPTIRPDRVALLGIRPLNASETALARDSDVHLFTMSDIDRLALATVTQRALSHIGRGRADLHLSFDFDMCDPAIAPGVPPLAGRLSYREAHRLMELVTDTGRLQALDLVEVNPTVDTHHNTAELAVQFGLATSGQRIL